MNDRLTDFEKAGLAARVENQTGLYIAEVQEYELAEPVRGGTCAWCGGHIKQWFCARWCDPCIDRWLAEPKGKWPHPRAFFEANPAPAEDGEPDRKETEQSAP